MHGEMALVGESGHGGDKRRRHSARKQLARATDTNLHEIPMRRQPDAPRELPNDVEWRHPTF